MRILLAHNSLYFPSHGGGDKSNRLLMEALAARGHSVRVIARMEHFGDDAHRQLARELHDRQVSFEETDNLIRFTRNAVDVHTLTRSPHLRAYFGEQIAEFDPQVILTSTDDPAQLLFDLAGKQSKAHVVYLIRATIAVPFGPDSSMLNPQRTATLKQADGVVGVSEYVAQYARQWGGLDAVHVPISLMEPGNTEALGRFANPYVTLVNPCAVKGIGIFLALAEAMPHLQFAAVPTWGTTPEERERLGRQPNVTLLPPVDHIADVLRQTRVMLVPSVWAEARSRIVMEAMLRGIPVMASDVGGLREAKLGIPYVLPVNLIRHYHATLDSNMVPLADVPPQDTRPWQQTLARLTSDEEHWRQIAHASRTAALLYLKTLTADPFEAYLDALIQKPKKPVNTGLSEDKKRLLALRLKQRAKPVWFPRCAAHVWPRLFCFPHAGAGTLAYRDFHIPGYATCPALLPGREDRATEAPFDKMTLLVEALAEAIEPLLTGNSVFFGHSMGAGIAFELVRRLRHTGRKLPAALVVSGARAPQYRVSHEVPTDLSDEDLASEVQALGSLPGELVLLALPALRADLQLYRSYRYIAGEPLAVPLLAYGGSADPNVSPVQLTEWSEQTTGNFKQRTFPGGHFYLRSNLPAVLHSLAEDLTPV